MVTFKRLERKWSKVKYVSVWNSFSMRSLFSEYTLISHSHWEMLLGASSSHFHVETLGFCPQHKKNGNIDHINGRMPKNMIRSDQGVIKGFFFFYFTENKNHISIIQDNSTAWKAINVEKGSRSGFAKPCSQGAFPLRQNRQLETWHCWDETLIKIWNLILMGTNLNGHKIKGSEMWSQCLIVNAYNGAVGHGESANPLKDKIWFACIYFVPSPLPNKVCELNWWVPFAVIKPLNFHKQNMCLY